MRKTVTLLALLALALGLAGGAAAGYGWPVRPFDKQHAIRGFFGDPRTVFTESLFANGINGPGSFSFHNGLDITAPNETPVYPVASGVAHVVSGATVHVTTLDGRTFQYFHVVPEVLDGEQVVARRTILGRVQAPYEHVHLSEIDGIRVVNPLLKGHLRPYVDRTRPVVDEIEFRSADGRPLGSLGVCGRISIVASALDRPPLAVVGPFAGLPVAPALVTWEVVKLGKGIVIPRTTTVDLRRTLPLPRDFWNVYARGTYQNAPRFGLQQFNAMPGRFLFLLTSALETKTLGNGVFVVTVHAADARANAGALSRRFSVLNTGTASGCPNPPPTGTTTTTTGTTTTVPDPGD